MDIITYCEDTAALVAEVKDKFPDRIDDTNPNNPIFLITKTPTIRNGNKTLALVRCSGNDYQDLLSLTSLNILGSYNEIFDDNTTDTLYKSVYPYDTPVTYTDEHGVDQTYMRPKKIGVLA